jgi:hypothetical protein
MRSPLENPLRRWLAAEAAERTEAAESALTALFAELPAPPPPPGFADRVLRRAGLVPVARRAPRPVRWAAAGILAVVCGVLALLPALLVPLVGGLGAGDAAAWLAGAVAAAARWLIRAGDVWETVALVAGGLVRTPLVALAAAITLVAAALALRMLVEMLARERSSQYVDSPV